MSVLLCCSRCGRNIQMRTEILAKNWRKSGKSRAQYKKDYVCKKCRLHNTNIILDNKGMMEIPSFKRFALELRNTYKSCVKSGITKENIQKFQNSVILIMKNNGVKKFEYIIIDGILYGIRLVDFPIFGNIEISTL